MKLLYLPKKLFKDIERTTCQKSEIDGVLFYKKDDYGNFYFADWYQTGKGNFGVVETNQSRDKVVRKFLSENPKFGRVIFHTHSKGTISKYGNYFAQNFSGGDYNAIQINSIRGVNSENPNDYFELLFAYQSGNDAEVFCSQPSKYEFKFQDWEEDDGSNWKDTKRNIRNKIERLENIIQPQGGI